METDFMFAAALTLIAAVLAVTRANAVHALLYLIVALLGVAVVFASLGAPFAALLQVIIYAGAITVLFVFVVMMLNLGPAAEECERHWQPAGSWLGPGLVGLLLFGELVLIIMHGDAAGADGVVDAKQVGMALFGPYLIVVELASLLLLAGLVVVWHVGQGGIGERR